MSFALDRTKLCGDTVSSTLCFRQRFILASTLGEYVIFFGFTGLLRVLDLVPGRSFDDGVAFLAFCSVGGPAGFLLPLGVAFFLPLSVAEEDVKPGNKNQM